jgi:hypothetical protein
MTEEDTLEGVPGGKDIMKTLLTSSASFSGQLISEARNRSTSSARSLRSAKARLLSVLR